MSMMFWNLCRKNTSIVVMSWISSMVMMPRRSASQMWNRRWSSVRATPFLISASDCIWMRGAIMLSSLISQPRTAFISAPSKVLSMAMTSPVAFIWVPRVLSA